MKNKEINRSFIEVVKRFLSPILIDPLLYFRAFIIYTIWAITPLIHVIFLEKTISYLNIWSKILFEKILVSYVIFIVIIEILERLFRNWWWTEVTPLSQKNIHRYYIKKYVKLDNTSTEKVWTWKIVSILETWLKEWWRLIDMTFEMWLRVFYTFLFTIYMIFRVDIIYGLLFLIIYILLHIFSLYLNTFLIKHRNQRIEEKHNYTKQLVKIIMSKFEVLQNWKVDNEVDVLDDRALWMLKANKKMVPYLHVFFRLPIFFIFVVRILVFLILWYQVLENKISISVLVWLSGSLILMSKWIEDSIRFVKDITKEFSSITKLWDFFDTIPEIQWYETGKQFIYKSWIIDLNKISFWYNNEKKVLNNFSLNIEWWKITALVWNSGGWKTTLVKVVSQFIRQDKWKLVIDWQDISKVSLKSYYKNIWYLTQEPSVFDGSIIDNLTYAIDWDINENEIDDIIKLSKCEFIYDFKDWLDTQIWERWVKLSWGQKQRLAIAKIMLKNPKIIILDEPTSALDSFSEELITKAMNNLFKWRTVIVIAHRLQTVKHADEIIVIENWQIAERWTHKELISQKWIYNRMLELQSGF